MEVDEPDFAGDPADYGLQSFSPHEQTDELRSRGLEVIEQIVEEAELDERTGEVILGGRWGPGQRSVEERFDQVDDIAYFLENFGWSIDSTGGSRYITSAIHFKPFGKRQVLDRADVLALLRKHRLKPTTHESADDEMLYSVRSSIKQTKLDAVRIELVTANAELLDFLKRHPAMIQTIAPRQLEEVVASIFKNQGFDVELTPQTRDGGYDIRALRKDGFGTLLYLVECKRYAPKHPVGVELGSDSLWYGN